MTTATTEQTNGAPPPRLDVTKTPDVKYCIPLWLRDEQIKRALGRTTRRLAPRMEDPHPDPVAVVCYGPSLNDTWEQIRGFRYVITCSGAHRFLVERGITPTWHVEVDPRAHKIALIGPPQRATEYLIASTCHGRVFDHLAGFTVTLWHIFDGADDAYRVIPRGEWSYTGGNSVGLRALAIARTLGFVNLHIFGMDGCEGATGKHAAAHPNQPKGYSLTEYEGREYRTTPSMLAVAQQTWHELDELRDVTPTFYGDGLIQAMAKRYVRTAAPTPDAKRAIAFNKPVVITPEYQALNRQMHHEALHYGVGGTKYAPIVLDLCKTLKPASVLDYGCGKGYLARELPFPIWEYDPAIPGKDEAPRPADLVVCTDVLEHIEPDCILAVLDDLKRCVRQVGYFVIHTGPSSKTLADGRNAHILQRPRGWWEQILGEHFAIGKVFQKKHLLFVIVGPKT